MALRQLQIPPNGASILAQPSILLADDSLDKSRVTIKQDQARMRKNGQVGMMLLAAVVLVSGCGKSGDETAKARSSTPPQVSKWKHQPKSATAGPMGLVIETQGSNVTAISIHGLKAGPGFVSDSGLSAGKFLVQQGVIILPIGLPPFATVEDWLANKGSYWEVLFKPGGTNVMATIKSMGVPEHPIEFLPFQE